MWEGEKVLLGSELMTTSQNCGPLLWQWVGKQNCKLASDTCFFPSKSSQLIPLSRHFNSHRHQAKSSPLKVWQPHSLPKPYNPWRKEKNYFEFWHLRGGRSPSSGMELEHLKPAVSRGASQARSFHRINWSKSIFPWKAKNSRQGKVHCCSSSQPSK